MTEALLIVDVQNDFMPFGSLPVEDGDAVVSIANKMAPSYEFVVATQDWHPPDHGSFASNHPGKRPGDAVVLGGVDQVLWPDHCVQNLPGASFHSGLDVTRIDAVVHKGTDREIDSYSAFFDNGHRKDTGLAGLLRARRIDRVVLVGLATDYCVKFTALDGRREGFDVTIAIDGVRGIDLVPGDVDRTFVELRSAGCRLATSEELRLPGAAGA